MSNSFKLTIKSAFKTCRRNLQNLKKCIDIYIYLLLYNFVTNLYRFCTDAKRHIYLNRRIDKRQLLRQREVVVCLFQIFVFF